MMYSESISVEHLVVKRAASIIHRASCCLQSYQVERSMQCMHDPCAGNWLETVMCNELCVHMLGERFGEVSRKKRCEPNGAIAEIFESLDS